MPTCWYATPPVELAHRLHAHLNAFWSHWDAQKGPGAKSPVLFPNLKQLAHIVSILDLLHARTHTHTHENMRTRIRIRIGIIYGPGYGVGRDGPGNVCTAQRCIMSMLA